MDLAEDDLESALDDLAEEAPDLSPSEFAEEFDLDLEPSDFAEDDLDLDPSDLADVDLDLEPFDFADCDLDPEPSDLLEDLSVFLPEDRDEVGLESLLELADEALDPTLVATLLLSGERFRDLGASSTTSLDSAVEGVEVTSSVPLDISS